MIGAKANFAFFAFPLLRSLREMTGKYTFDPIFLYKCIPQNLYKFDIMKSTINVPWYFPILAITAICLLIHVVSQQIIRQSANDPQIQMAEDIATTLNKGKQPSDFNSQDKIDIAQSLAPYIMIYDVQGKPLASSGQIDGNIPNLPTGVFDAAKNNGRNMISWKPKANVRAALVVVPYHSGFVAAGRSLREVEIREGNLNKIIAVFWVVAMLVIGGILLLNRNRV